ncbi:hypothetical protein U0070_007596 [Myodes glareolus]|uniref:Platelet-derived growth factor (PDGF) family profile domain-containing protein n=1 Tax=Myodes glareolus TaxID=447135 RepID=A0AAW0IZ23_MYOGA
MGPKELKGQQELQSDGGNSPEQRDPTWVQGLRGRVVPFNEVWGRSYCRPIEKLVDIMDEYPDEVAYIFSPSCVLLSRCSGCCGDESLHCVPLKTANITMQILKIPTIGDPSYAEMTFSQDVLCDCR